MRLHRNCGRSLIRFLHIGNTSRAPLGNKTTNAKARAGHSAGVKDIVKEIEKGRQTAQKPKQKTSTLVPTFEVQADRHSNDDEPEYAPPQPKALPYESDVLPKGGLTFEGLKKKNLFKGYHAHFHNPVDENGVSRMDRKFQREMDQVTMRAIERNEQDLENLDWSVADLQTPQSKKPVSTQPMKENRVMLDKKQPLQRQRQAPTLTSKRAASALGLQPSRSRTTVAKPAVPQVLARRPLTSLSKNKPVTSDDVTSASPGEAASRTTIGYNKGRAASNMIYGQKKERPATSQSAGPMPDPNLTITPARLGRASPEKQSRPQFTSIFYDDDEGDLAPIQYPLSLSDEEEEEFEMKLDI